MDSRFTLSAGGDRGRRGGGRRSVHIEARGGRYLVKRRAAASGLELGRV